MRSVKSESRILIISNKLIRFHLKNSLNKKKSLNKLFDQNFLIKNILKYLQKLIITKQYITYYYIILTGFEYHFAKIINLSNTFVSIVSPDKVEKHCPASIRVWRS